MEALVHALNTYDGSLKAKLELENLMCSYSLTGPRYVDPFTRMSDAEKVYDSLTGVTMTRDAFLAICHQALEEEKEKRKRKILTSLRNANEEDKTITDNVYKLLERLYLEEVYPDMEENTETVEQFVHDFFASEPDQKALIVRLKEAYGMIYQQADAHAKFIAALNKPWEACGFLCMMDGFDDSWSRAEARAFFEQEIIPRTPEDKVKSVWHYFEKDLVCSDDAAEPMDKKAKH